MALRSAQWALAFHHCVQGLIRILAPYDYSRRVGQGGFSQVSETSPGYSIYKHYNITDNIFPLGTQDTNRVPAQAGCSV